MEHRWTHRVDTHVPTRLETRDGRIIEAVIRNISVGGFYVETAHPPDRHACIDVCVQLPDNGGWCLHRAPAVVTNTRRHGAGLMFSAIDRRMLAALNRLTAGSAWGLPKFDGLRSM